MAENSGSFLQSPSLSTTIEVDFAELRHAFENFGETHRCYLDVRAGEVLLVSEEHALAIENGMPKPPSAEWARAEYDRAREVLTDDTERYRRVPRNSPREDLSVLRSFARQTAEPMRAQLEHALTDAEPFRAFRACIETWPDVDGRWEEYAEQDLRERVFDWLSEQGLLSAL